MSHFKKSVKQTYTHVAINIIFVTLIVPPYTIQYAVIGLIITSNPLLG